MKILLAIALLASAAPAIAVQSGGSTTAATGTSDDRKVCRREEVSSASRISRRRVCLTPEQWRERRGGATASAEEGQDELDGHTRTYSTMPTGGMEGGRAGTGGGGGTLGPH